MSKTEKKNAPENSSQRSETEVDKSVKLSVNPVQELTDRIETLVQNLYYTSETDAEIECFKGVEAETVTIKEILKQTGSSPNAKVEQQNFDEFFDRLTKIEDWFGDEEKANAAKYAALKDLMTRNLRDLTVVKIGKIQLDIYAVGLPAENILIGIKTKAVET